MRAERNGMKGGNGASNGTEDIKLVREIAAGSIPAWHEFLLRYSGLIFAVLRRELFTEDEDDVRNVYVDIAKVLYEGELAKYSGEASLATWLIVYTRSRAIDSLRKRYGRRRMPRWHKNLSDFDRDVLRFFFAERLPLEVVVALLGWSGHAASALDVAESIERIQNLAGARYLRWIEDENRARGSGIMSRQMLRCIIQLQLDSEERAKRERSDSILAEQEAMHAADRVREAITHLATEEKNVIFLRYSKGMTAREISDELRLGGERRAYTIISRVLRKMHRMMLRKTQD